MKDDRRKDFEQTIAMMRKSRATKKPVRDNVYKARLTALISLELLELFQEAGINPKDQATFHLDHIQSLLKFGDLT